MIMTLTRQYFNKANTVGALDVNGKVLYTLEDVVREVPGKPVHQWKIPGETAIPRGTYQVIVSFSQRFQKEMPLLLGVEGFEGVRIHSGNTEKDTEGCILLGKSVMRDNAGVANSRAAFSEFMYTLEPILERGNDMWIEIK